MTRITFSVIIVLLLIFSHLASAESLKSEIMTESQLISLMREKVTRYRAVVYPEDQLTVKKFFRSPPEYKGKIVALTGQLGRDPNFGPEYLFFATYPPEGGLKVRGIQENSEIYKFSVRSFIVGEVDILNVKAQRPFPTSYPFIQILFICGINEDSKTKRAEVACIELKKPRPMSE